MLSDDSLQSVLKVTPPFYSWLVKLVTGAIGLFGISGIFYGIGFLVLRSRYSYLGIWGGIPFSDADVVVQEGARFFYNLIYALVDPLQLQSKSNLLLYLLLMALAWDLWNTLYSWLQKIFTWGVLRAISQIWIIFPTGILAIVLVLTALLLTPSWIAVSYSDVLYSGPLPPCLNNKDGCSQEYVQVVWTTLGGIAIGWLLYQRFWPTLNFASRVLVVAQWLIVAAAVGILPIAYGNLMSTMSYPSFTMPNTVEGEYLLLEQTSNTWILWNKAKNQTELVPRKNEEKVIIGEKKSILKTVK